jgi:MFS transporter, DHA1 family, multidrug resistance protein
MTRGTSGCALSPSIFWLSLFRAVSAVGAAASTVIPRAVVRDLATGHAAAVMMSQLTLVLGAAPVLAPSLGGAILIFANWRWVFWVLAAYATLCCVLVRFLLPETLPPERRIRLNLGEQLGRFSAILRERSFLSHAAMGCSASFSFFAYLSGSSPVFIRGFHLSPSQYALIFGVCSLGLIASSQINARIVPRFGAWRVLRTVGTYSSVCDADTDGGSIQWCT